MLALKKIGPTRLIRNDFYTAVETAENRGASAEELKGAAGPRAFEAGAFSRATSQTGNWRSDRSRR